MLSSVPITIGGEVLDLQFTPLDVDEIETAQAAPMAMLLTQDRILRIGTLASMLQFGLKKPGQFTPDGSSLVRAIPAGPAGKVQALEIVHDYLKGRPLSTMSELANYIFRALAAGEWWNMDKIQKEAVASVPQAVEPPKNSEGPGSS